ncbi:hypothetical protein BH11MYX1_BH11MYX1_39600 [soil metagenome]
MVRFSARQLVGAALVAWLLVGTLALLSGPPLGHDEAAYAVAARGDAPTWNYRSSGMIAIARVGLALGGSEAALRAVILVVATSLILGTFALGRAAFDARTGAWAALVLVGAHPMASRSAELIGDLAASGLMLGGLAVLIGELERAKPRWSLMLAAPLFVGAFYLRYGSAPVVAMVAVLAVALYAKQLASMPMLATVVLAVALLVPHVQHSIEATGSALGILNVSAHMPRRAYVGEGLVTYLTSNPFRFYGALVAPVMLAGLAGLVRRAPRWRPQVFIIVLALAQIVSLGIQSHGQPRYVFFATALLVIAGVDAIRRYFAAHPIDRIGDVALVLVGTAWLVLAALIVPFHHEVARRRAPLYAAAATVRDDAKGRPCAIAANVVPQLIWATHCMTIVARVAPQLPHPWPPTELHYIVSVPHAQLGAQAVSDVAATVPGTPHELAVPDPHSQVWRVDPTATSSPRPGT